MISIWDVILMSRTVTELSTFIMCHTGEIQDHHKKPNRTNFSHTGARVCVCAHSPACDGRRWLAGNFPLKMFFLFWLSTLGQWRWRCCWCNKLNVFSAAIYFSCGMQALVWMCVCLCACVFICDNVGTARSPRLSSSKDHVYDIVLSLNKINAMRCDALCAMRFFEFQLRRRQQRRLQF